MRLILTFLTILLAPVASAQDLPTCDGLTLPCQIEWMEAGQLRSARFATRDGDDFSAYVDSSGTVSDFVTADASPTLRDFDGDGRIDIGLFDLLGMVNGAFQMFVRTDDGFVLWGLLNGSEFNLDDSGLMTANGRSSCCEREIAMHDPRKPGVPPLFALAARPEELSEEIPQCVLRTNGDETALRREYGPLIAAYCAIYDEPERVAARTRADLLVSTVTGITGETVFACTLDNGKHVHLARRDAGVTYAYGAPEDAELIFTVPAEDVGILPVTPSAELSGGHVALPRGGYVYRVEYAATGREGNDRPSGKLTVSDPSGATVFARACDPGTVFQAVQRLSSD